MTVLCFRVVNDTPLLEPAFPDPSPALPLSTLPVNYTELLTSQREEAALLLCMLSSMSRMSFSNFFKPDNAIFPLAQITCPQ